MDLNRLDGTYRMIDDRFKLLQKLTASGNRGLMERFSEIDARLRAIEEKLGIKSPPPLDVNDPLSALEQGVEDGGDEEGREEG